MLFEKSLYNGAGVDKAYDRSQRRGPILPVNRPALKTPSDAQDMVVVWFQRNRHGVAWPVRPVDYDLQWPTTAETITIANLANAPRIEEDHLPRRPGLRSKR